MFLQQEFYSLWASLELFMSLTHLFVFLGFRNSKLGFLRRQQNYFLIDGMIHLINALLFPPKTVGVPISCLWIFAFFVHIYYYRALKINPPPSRKEDGQVEEDNSHKIPRIFHWSCVEYQFNRFDLFQSGRQMLETTIDVVAHTTGFLLAFRQIQSIWYQVAALAFMFALFYRQMLSLKYFLTDPKMMPVQLRRFFKDYSATTMTN